MIRSILLAGAALALVGTGASAEAPPPSDLAARTLAIRDQALADKTAWNLLESLTTDVGPRPVGTPAMVRARDWGVATLRRLGFQNVHVETFTTPAWTRGEETAEVVGPTPHKLAILGLGNSSPTPTTGLTAEAVVFRTYQQMLDQPVGSLAGKIAVVTQAMPRTQDASSYGIVGVQRRAGPVEAAKRGAVAYLVRSLSTDDTRLPHTGTANAGGIPAAALSTPDAELLERLAARDKPVTIRLKMASSANPAAEAYNVVGEIRGASHPDEVLVVGGHLDSWDPGTGAIDDASGIAIATAGAKLAGARPPARTIRVVMWGSEEQSGSGRAYAQAHAAEAGKMILAGESDLGADRIWSINLPKGSLVHPAMRAFTAAMPPLGATVSPAAPRAGGSDIEGLMAAGVPFVDLNQDASRYFDLHHSADDTLDKVDPAHLAQNVAVWASLLYTVANSDIDFRALATAQSQDSK